MIEMLAVVVLLGLLMGLLFPAISRYIIDTRNNTYKMYEADMKVSAQNLMTECVEKNDTICIPGVDKYKKVTLSELISTGYSNKLRDPKDDSKDCDPFQSFVLVKNEGPNITNLSYEVCLVCGDYQSGKCEDLSKRIPPQRVCTEEMDDEPPLCGVAQGDSKVWTNKDRTITIGCSDNCTGCVQDTFTKKFTEEGETGTITIADNAGKTNACPVDVYIDKTPPKCTLEVEGTMGENGWYKASPRPVVKLKVDERDTSGIATYGMGVSRSNYDFNKETEYEVQDGITTVYGYVKDNAGNVGTCYREIPYDPVIPVIKSIDYGTVVYGVGTEKDKADLLASKTSTKISLTSITGEYGNIYGVYVYMASGKGGTATIKDTVKNKTLTVTIPTSTSKARNYFATPTSFSNLEISFASATELNNVTRIELLTRDDTVGYYTNRDVTLYINATDSVSGRGDYKFDNNPWQKDNSYTYPTLATVIMKVKDTSGNESLPETREITNIDKTEPKCTITFGSDRVVRHENDYFWENVPVKLTKDDNAEIANKYTKSGTRNYGLKNSSGLEYNGNDTGTQTKDTTSHTWYGYVRDNAGNLKDCSSVVKKDSQNPTCELQLTGTKGDNNWYKEGNVDVTFKKYEDVKKDNSMSDKASWDITTSATPSYNKSTKKTQSTNTTTSGITYYGYIKDKAGRTNKCEIWFKLDKTKPYCKLTTSGTVGNDNWYTSNVSVSFVSGKGNTGDDLSGTASYGIDSVTGSKTASHTTDTKSVTYTGHIKDNAGNTNTCSIKFKRDASVPSCTPSKSHQYHSNGVTTGATCADGTSGVVTASFSNTNQTSDKTYTCTNGAGLTNSCTVSVSSAYMYQKNTCYQHNWGGPSSSVCGTEDCNCVGKTIDNAFRGTGAEARCRAFCSPHVCSCSDTGTGTDDSQQFCTCHYQSTTEFVCDTCAKSCYSAAWGCKIWNGWSGTGTYYPTSSCTASYGDVACNGATVYY